MGGQAIVRTRYDAGNTTDSCTSHSRPQSGASNVGNILGSDEWVGRSAGLVSEVAAGMQEESTKAALRGSLQATSVGRVSSMWAGWRVNW
jgi:hypothetical protein